MRSVLRRFAYLLVLAVACTDPGAPGPGPAHAPNSLDNTPRENFEAEAMALHVSGDLVAPDDLYEEFLFALSYIRDTWRDSIPDLERTGFVPRWMPGELLIRLSVEATRRYRGGTYTDFDSLNSVYRLAECDSIFVYQGMMWIHLIFEGRLHPERLAEEYSTVASADYVDPNGVWNNTWGVYPWMMETGRTYLFRYGYGDCPSGCTSNRYSYFKEIDGTIVWVGSFIHRDEPEPDWWPEASVGWGCYYKRPECPE